MWRTIFSKQQLTDRAWALLLLASITNAVGCAESENHSTIANPMNSDLKFNPQTLAKFSYEATDKYLFVERRMPTEEYWQNVFLNDELLAAKWPLNVFDYIVSNCASIDEGTGYNFEGIVFRNVRSLKTETTEKEVIKRWAIPKQQVNEVLKGVCKA
ncbi:MAG: hypothetical protein CL926_11660 [Deltaproteobacteria bacterium]|nr:hypothetical protein [Deltaproteobacteria bacterium]